ncbi:MAG TPA: hypothetical protein VEL74_07400, partial [Thermoanaerobaculia bacterium]|nr:hypothetical protein [Thermoanaerobaculia bacterium]
MEMALFIHILGGGLGLVSGYIALFAAKGARLHRQSGMLFVYAMLGMSLIGAVVAALSATEGSVIAGLLTAYMVITALTTVRPAVAGLRWLNITLMALALAVGVTSLAWGVQ